MNLFQGSGVALVTPFDKDKNIDFKALANLLSYTRLGGVDYFVVLGTTGESATLTKEEKYQIFEFVAKENQNKLPLVAGIGGNHTADILKDLKNYPLKDYSAILSVSPYYNKPSQEGIFKHYETLSKESKLPIILYNVPSRTGSNMEALTTLRIAKECKNVVGIKEASGNFDQINQLLTQKPKDFQIISGDDGIAVPMISIGATGVISVIANSHPTECSEMIHLALKGDFQKAKLIHQKLSEWIPVLFKESNPTGVKQVLEVRKICQNFVRLPLVEASENLNREIEVLEKNYKP